MAPTSVHYLIIRVEISRYSTNIIAM